MSSHALSTPLIISVIKDNCLHLFLRSPSLNVIVVFSPTVLRERLTERELDFLKLPVSSLYHSVNRDRLSMTTDELLSIPHDGSMPVTHTSAFLQGPHTSSLLLLLSNVVKLSSSE